jgi:hypothetical protein
MTKVIELIVVLVLLVFAFFAGVKYSDSVKSHASWIFESKDEEIELPDLSDETVNESGAAVEEKNAEEGVDQMTAPQDSAPVDNEVKPAPAVRQ